MLVLDLALAEGLKQELGTQLQNLLVTHLQSSGRFRVTTAADVRAMLGVEEQRQLTGCSDAACMAEIGGALNAGWMVSGNVGRLGQQRMLTLKLLDVGESRIDNQLTRELPRDNALPEAMRRASYALLGLEAPVVRPWYSRWWVWTALGAVIAGGATTAVIVAQTESLPESTLGEVTF